MSEKLQNTSASIRRKMIGRYGDELRHKHDKNHRPYRMHSRSHPVQLNHYEEEQINESTGSLRANNLRKIRKRLDKGRYH